MCNAKNGSIVNCIFISSPKPKVNLNNQLAPVKEVAGFDNYSYVVSVTIPWQPRKLMISNGYSSAIRVECEFFCNVTIKNNFLS